LKLIVQIPCYNEEETLPQTVADIAREIDGVDEVRILIVDDGSTDRTVGVAREIGVDYIVQHKNNRGLARTFRTGLDACLRLGADIVVNTDGDNQYGGHNIPALIKPIIDGQADIVVGDRQTHKVEHFSTLKKYLQRVGSGVVRRVSGTDLPDAVSGFRAISRDAAMQMNIVSPFSYTIEMIIQAGKKHLAIASVPVDTNPKTRESRLFKSIPKFIARQVTTIIRMYTMYQPMRVFFYLGLLAVIVGMVPILRFFWFFLIGDGDGHIQSLVLGGAMLVIGIMTFLIGLVADLINYNRQLLELTLERTRRVELAVGAEDSLHIDDGARVKAAPTEASARANEARIAVDHD
jgi:glycosyltransferase involved in cell wall biosynthesis